MIILDTNVISETQKPVPDERVMAWLDTLDLSSTYLTAITVAELLYGVGQLPDGRRKADLDRAVATFIGKTFYGRVLAFDAAAANFFGPMMAAARREGQTISFADGAIAAIARANKHATVATRDIGPFAALRVAVVNPWA